MEMNVQKGGRNMASRKIKNIYARGADDGLWMGLYLTLVFGVTGISLYVGVLNLVALVLMAGVPFMAFYFLRRTHKATYGMTLLSALWMQGIVMFACASLIFGLLSFIYLRWIDPDFFVRVLTLGIEYYSRIEAEGADAVADELRMILDGGALPNASTIVMVWMWLTMFGGAVLSLVLSAIVKSVGVKRV